MYSYTRSHIPPTQPVPIISPPIVQATPLQGMRYYDYHHQSSSYEAQPSPHLERRPSQPYVRHSGVPGPYSPPTPSAEFAALYLRDHNQPAHDSHGRSHSRGRAHPQTSPRIREPETHGRRPHANGHAHSHSHTKVQPAHIPATSRTKAQPRPAAHREHRKDGERERGRTLHRHSERRPSVSEASHVATLGGTSSRGTTSSRPAPARPSRHHQHQHQPAAHGRTTTTTAPSPAPAPKHAPSQNHKHASQSHARDHRSHNHAHTTQPSTGNGHSYAPAHHHHDSSAPGSSSLGVAYVPTAAPSSRSPRDYSHFDTDEQRARSQSAPRHRLLRPGRSAMRERYNSRSRSKSRVRFGQEKRPVKPIAIPVGGRSRSRKPNVDFNWLHVPR
ncbi:hypothetical protein PENSPDRAFT_343965 [Peniophora sp. CONT]|nr:hypothetical protein PENSPDRAFT_343965 [Peniophora sp. CONT]